MKTLALVLLALPLAACATTPTAVSQNCSGFTGINHENCIQAFAPHYAPVSHWQMTTGIYRGFGAPGAPASSRATSFSPAGSVGGEDQDYIH